MYKQIVSLTAIFAVVLSAIAAAASPYASAVVNYNPGTGYALGHTDTSAVVGPPSASDSYGDPVDPFGPPWETNQILSVGAGGSLTVQFDPPLVNLPTHPYGRDFTIFGNSFFIVTNAVDEDYNYIGTQATGGSLYSDACEATVSVSADGVTFYKLNPSLAPALNVLYPTYATGNFQIPVNPALSETNFAGATLADIQTLYNGSAGGTSYSINWAQDTNSNGVYLLEVRYVRVDVSSGDTEIAGFASVSNSTAARVIAEDFSHNPTNDGWLLFGDTNLFSWNSTNRNLQVTWDSTRPNSYFYHPLGTILGKSNDFSMAFDLYLTDYSVSNFTFQLSAGFQNIINATNADFFRGGDAGIPDIVEFDYFPAFSEESIAPTIWPVVCDTNRNYNYNGSSDETFEGLPIGVTMRVTMNYASSNQTITTTITTNGVSIGAVDSVPLQPGFLDFRNGVWSVESYSSAGQDPDYAGYILAHGTIGNILLTVPPPPVRYLQVGIVNGVGQAQFASQTGWNYTLMKSYDLANWTPASAPVNGTGGTLTMQDGGLAETFLFYRVNAQRNY